MKEIIIVVLFFGVLFGVFIGIPICQENYENDYKRKCKENGGILIETISTDAVCIPKELRGDKYEYNK